MFNYDAGLRDILVIFVIMVTGILLVGVLLCTLLWGMKEITCKSRWQKQFQPDYHLLADNCLIKVDGVIIPESTYKKVDANILNKTD